MVDSLQTEVALVETQYRKPNFWLALGLGGLLLATFLALPWMLMACRAMAMPGWTYGAAPMVGWLRVWALAPVWLLLGAVVALLWALASRRPEGET